MCEKKLLNLSNVLIHRMLHLHSRQVYLKEFQVKRFVSCILPCPPNNCSVDFCYRFENDAKVRKDKLEKQRRAKEKQIDEMAKGSKRKNNYNPKTLQILKRKGLLNQSSGEVVERLHKWKQTTKNKKQDQADRLSKIDPITGKDQDIGCSRGFDRAIDRVFLLQRQASLSPYSMVIYTK